MVFVKPLFSILKPYNPLAVEFEEGESIFYWIFIWFMIAVITVLMGIIPVLL
jgi:hypothetical protein